MTKIIEVIDKIKADNQLKSKVIRAVAVFSIFAFIVIVLVLTSEEKTQEEQQQESIPREEASKYDFIPADTASVGDKSSIFKKMEWEEEQNNKVPFEEDNTLFSQNSQQNNTSSSFSYEAPQDNSDAIDEYIAHRNRERQRREQREEQENQARNYNPYGNRSDWQETPTYSSTENRGQFTSQEQPTSKKSKKGQSFEDLSPTEQRRILLETGKSSYEETAEFSAMILSSGMVKSGQTITLITKEDAYINLNKIPKGTTIAGIVSFSENRLQVNFSTIRLKNKIIKVNLTLYSLDGLEGLPVDSNLFNKDVQDTGEDEISQEVTSTRVGRIASALYKGSKSRKEQKVDLGRDIMCLLVNNNVE